MGAACGGKWHTTVDTSECVAMGDENRPSADGIDDKIGIGMGDTETRAQTRSGNR